MATIFDVTPEEMIKASERIMNLVEDYKGYVSDFKNAVQKLNGSVYSGEGAEVFKNKTAEFDDDFVKMSDWMEAYATFLNNAAKMYDDSQNNASARAKALQG